MAMKKQHIIWFILGMGMLASLTSCGHAVHYDRPAVIDSLKVETEFERKADSIATKAENTSFTEKQRLKYQWESVRYLDSAAKYVKLATGD